MPEAHPIPANKKFIDLTGNRYGRLAVSSFAGMKEQGTKGRKASFWNCTCECGETAVIAGSRLKNGETKSCGCLAREVSSANGKSAQSREHGTRFVDLVGQRFGRLTVVSYAGSSRKKSSRGGPSIWNCICDCGRKATANTSDLRCGGRESCGCSRSNLRGLLEIDLNGESFGCLTVIGIATKANKFTRWACQCDCDEFTTASTSSLLTGQIRDCGCGSCPSGTASDDVSPLISLFNSWNSMILRCYSESSTSYRDYGGRGITICKRWLNSFADFLADIGVRPSPTMSLDREKVNNGYWCGKPECPECGPLGREPNCRWSSKSTQANNRRQIGALTRFSDDELLAEVARRGLLVTGVT